MSPYDRLCDAMERTEPDCSGDDRYISDLRDLGNDDRAEMREICLACPLLAPCEKYALEARPPAGWWPTNLKVRSTKNG